MKLKLDENLGHHGKAQLEAAGHDMATVSEQGLGGAEDQDLFDICCSEGQAPVTLDHDFGQVLRFPPKSTSGIAVLECMGRVTPAMIRSRIADLVALLRQRPIAGRCGSSSRDAFASMMIRHEAIRVIHR